MNDLKREISQGVDRIKVRRHYEEQLRLALGQDHTSVPIGHLDCVLSDLKSIIENAENAKRWVEKFKDDQVPLYAAAPVPQIAMIPDDVRAAIEYSIDLIGQHGDAFYGLGCLIVLQDWIATAPNQDDTQRTG